MLLDNLVCPDSGRALASTATRSDGEDILEGVLRAEGEQAYPIAAGIPRFVGDPSEDNQTARSFSEKWQAHDYYRNHTGRFYTEWFLDRYGFGDEASLGELLGSAKYVLDAGTGSGRDAANFAALTTGTVFAVDLTAGAIERAAGSVTADNVAFVQADLARLPFRNEFFDFINCDQVIHHTPDPPAAFAGLASKLKRGGEICVYVYRKKAAVREFVDDHVRRQIQGMSFDDAMKACEGLTQLGRVLSKLNAEITLDEDIEVLGIRRGTYDLQRFVHWNLFKCFWNDEFDFFTNNVVNADWYHPEHCHRYEPEAFRSWFSEGWDIVSWDVREAGISCRARKR